MCPCLFYTYGLPELIFDASTFHLVYYIHNMQNSAHATREEGNQPAHKTPKFQDERDGDVEGERGIERGRER